MNARHSLHKIARLNFFLSVLESVGIYILEECKILTTQKLLISVGSAEISKDLCSYLLRNFELKWGNDFKDTRYTICFFDERFIWIPDPSPGFDVRFTGIQYILIALCQGSSSTEIVDLYLFLTGDRHIGFLVVEISSDLCPKYIILLRNPCEQITYDNSDGSIENGLGSCMYICLYAWFSQISDDLKHRASPEWYHTIATWIVHCLDMKLLECGRYVHTWRARGTWS